MMDEYTLVPQPRVVENKNGNYSPGPNSLIHIKAELPQKILFTAGQLAETIRVIWNRPWEISSSRTLPKGQNNIALGLDPHAISHPQGYRAHIKPNQIEIIGNDYPGLFYGVQTLKQLITQSSNKRLPCMRIFDWPDFPVRGVMLDISRDKVYTLETLFMLVDEFAAWKINQLQLYMEHTFAYQGHETVWQDASPMTSEEIMKLDHYCAERFIELVPNQNSLGHMSRWLKHREYQHLAETTEPVQTPWGDVQKEPFSLAPTQPETLTFITSLYDQLLSNFSSKQINVGCDEAFDIGEGKSKGAVETNGTGQVYLDYLLALHRDLSRRGYQMQFWGDIILEHPDLIPQIPEDVIVLDWGYEADHPFTTETARFKKSGIPFYVCPGTSSWNSLASRISNMLKNCQTAAGAGLQNGAVGYLNTDWGDNGHWQQLPVSYPGFVAGAAFSWCLESNQDLNLESILNELVFADSASQIGGILMTIGEEYRRWGLRIQNSSPLFWLLQQREEGLHRFDFEDLSPIYESIDRLRECMNQLSSVQFLRKDSLIIQKEVVLTIKLMIHACKRAILIYKPEEQPGEDALLHEIRGLMADFQEAWLERNRVGGLAESLSRFEVLLNAYEGHHE